MVKIATNFFRVDADATEYAKFSALFMSDWFYTIASLFGKLPSSEENLILGTYSFASCSTAYFFPFVLPMRGRTLDFLVVRVF